MVTCVSYVLCPFCGKSTPLSKASFKAGDPIELGLIQVRECRGKKGFVKVSEKTLRECIMEHRGLIDELVDMCSGILMVVFEEGLPVHKPVFLLKYEQLQQKIRELETGDDSICLRLDDANRKIKRLTEEIKQWKAYRDDISPAFDDLQRENRRLKEQLQGEINKSEGYGFWVDDKSREIQQLKGENARLKGIIKRYENASLQ